MAGHDAFLRAILAVPHDNAPRLIYADWLEENGDVDRAEFIRVQCALAALDWNDPQRQHPADREELLLTEHWDHWDAELHQVIQGSMPPDQWRRWSEAWEHSLCYDFFLGYAFRGKYLWSYHRGFIEHVALPFLRFAACAPELFRLAPVWSLTGFGIPGEVGELTSCPHLARLRSLELKCDELRPEEVRMLAFSPHLAHLTELKLESAGLGDAGVQILASSPYLTGLTHLDLAGNEIGDAGALTLACSPSLAGLTSLNLGHNNITDAGVWALVESGYLRRPIQVMLHDNLCGRNEPLSREWPYC